MAQKDLESEWGNKRFHILFSSNMGISILIVFLLPHEHCTTLLLDDYTKIRHNYSFIPHITGIILHPNEISQTKNMVEKGGMEIYSINKNSQEEKPKCQSQVV